MKLEIHPSYGLALRFGITLLTAWLVFLYFCTFHIFPFAAIPAVAYGIITPVIIIRHPQPTWLDLAMVRSGYFFYCAFVILGACIYYAVFHR